MEKRSKVLANRVASKRRKEGEGSFGKPRYVCDICCWAGVRMSHCDEDTSKLHFFDCGHDNPV